MIAELGSGYGQPLDYEYAQLEGPTVCINTAINFITFVEVEEYLFCG